MSNGFPHRVYLQFSKFHAYFSFLFNFDIDTLVSKLCRTHGQIQREETGSEPLLEKSRVAIGFLRNTGMNPTLEAIEPLGSNCVPRYARKVLCEKR